MSAKPGISVVIPNFNGEILLPQILPTVYTALYNAGLPFEIIVVDDCSTDNTISVLQTKFPQVKVMQNERNSGFSISSNRGIYAAQYDWVLLLNSDVKLEPGYFLSLAKYMDRKNVFGVMGRIIGWDDELVQDGAKYPFFHGVKIKTSGNYLLEDRSAMEKNGTLFTMYVSGANAFLNKRNFEKAGGFNEMFSPFYVEDFELSLRAWRLGFECLYDYNAVCRHRTSSTIVGTNRKNYIRKIYNRNKMYLHAIHLDGGKRFIWFIQLFLECLVQLITFKFFYVKALGLFMQSYNGIKMSRRKLISSASPGRLLSVQDVVDKILDSVDEQPISRF